MKCTICKIELNRDTTIVATVTAVESDMVRLEITEPDDRRLLVRGKKPVAFPFFARTGNDVNELEFCSLACFKRKLKYEASKR